MPQIKDTIDKHLNLSKKDLFSLVAISLCISWQALSRIVIHFDGAGRVPIILIILAAIVNINSFKNFSIWIKRAVLIWLLWTIFHLMNLYIQGSEYLISNRPSDLYINLSEKFFFLFVCLVMLQKNFYRTIECIEIAFLFNILLYYSDSSWMIATGYERFLSSSINGNEIALEAVACVSIMPLLLAYRKKYFPILILVGSFCIGLILAIASRTASLAILPPIFSFCFIAFKYVKHNLFFLSFFAVIAIIAIPRAFHIFTNSVISQRFESREIITVGNLENESLATFFGERALYIENGYAVFKENPVFGIGYANYAEYFGHRNHVEYMAELSDGGIVGFSLFFFFFLCMLFPSFYAFKRNWKDTDIIQLYCLILSLLLFNLGLFTTSLMPFYVFSSIILTFPVVVTNSYEKFSNDLIEIDAQKLVGRNFK